MYNPNFKVFQSEHFRKQVGLLTFTPSVTEWCEKTNADYYKNGEWLKYAEEAEILNVAIFNTTAKKWRELNPNWIKIY